MSIRDICCNARNCQAWRRQLLEYRFDLGDSCGSAVGYAIDQQKSEI